VHLWAVTVPASGTSCCTSVFTSVDLPWPLGPTSASRSPCSKHSVTLRSTGLLLL
jgi:hypothetical protein